MDNWAINLAREIYDWSPMQSGPGDDGKFRCYNHYWLLRVPNLQDMYRWITAQGPVRRTN